MSHLSSDGALRETLFMQLNNLNNSFKKRFFFFLPLPSKHHFSAHLTRNYTEFTFLLFQFSCCFQVLKLYLEPCKKCFFFFFVCFAIFQPVLNFWSRLYYKNVDNTHSVFKAKTLDTMTLFGVCLTPQASLTPCNVLLIVHVKAWQNAMSSANNPALYWNK